MRRLLDDLLLLARADAGRRSRSLALVRRERVRLDEIAAEAVRSAEALDVGQDSRTGSAPARGDPGDADRLHQLLMILLDNAIRHTPRRGAHPRRRGGDARGQGPSRRARRRRRDRARASTASVRAVLSGRWGPRPIVRWDRTGTGDRARDLPGPRRRNHGDERPGHGATFVVTLPRDARSAAPGADAEHQRCRRRSGAPATREAHLLVTKISRHRSAAHEHDERDRQQRAQRRTPCEIQDRRFRSASRIRSITSLTSTA